MKAAILSAWMCLTATVGNMAQTVSDTEYIGATAQSVERYAEANRTLTYRERELATVSIPAGVGGATPLREVLKNLTTKK